MRSTRTGHRWAAMMVAATLMMLAAAIAAPAQRFTTLHSFDSSDGAYPIGWLIQATDGNLYGTTSAGASGYGTVFKISLSGALTTLHTFCSQSGCTDGAEPSELSSRAPMETCTGQRPKAGPATPVTVRV